MNNKVLKLSTLALSLIFAQAATNANETNETPYQLNDLPSALKLSFEQTDFKDRGETNLLGVNFLLQPYSWIYTGVGAYGAVNGDLGGLFVFGVDAGIRHTIYHNLWFDAGYFAGGGGARHSDDGDHSGFMGRPHAGLSYNLGTMALGFDFSRIHFPDYDTDSNQVALTLSMDGNFLYGNSSYLDHTLTSLSDVSASNYLGFYQTFIGFTPQTYFLEHDNGNMQLAGIEAGFYMSPSLYMALSTSGAYDSEEDGYMDAFIGFGHEMHLTQKLTGFLQGNLGAGGGGDADTGGGFMLKPMLGLNYYINPSFSIKAAGGYVKATNGNFRGAVANLGLMYNFLNAETGDLLPADMGNDIYEFKAWRVNVGSESYIGPQREGGKDEKNIGLVTISIDRLLNKYTYVTGQAGSAYSGNAGSYATGLIGFGVQTPTYARTRLTADVLTGAAGGASMAVDRGAIYEPEAGFMIDVSDHLSLNAKVGKVKAYQGDLDATTWSLGVSFRFATLQENH